MKKKLILFMLAMHLRLQYGGDVAALVRSHVNGLQPFESTIEQTTETMPPSHKPITAAAMTTNRITSLPESCCTTDTITTLSEFTAMSLKQGKQFFQINVT